MGDGKRERAGYRPAWWSAEGDKRLGPVAGAVYDPLLNDLGMAEPVHPASGPDADLARALSGFFVQLMVFPDTVALQARLVSLTGKHGVAAETARRAYELAVGLRQSFNRARGQQGTPAPTWDAVAANLDKDLAWARGRGLVPEKGAARPGRPRFAWNRALRTLAVAGALVLAILVGVWWQERSRLCDDALLRRRDAMQLTFDARLLTGSRYRWDIPRYCTLDGWLAHLVGNPQRAFD